MKHLKYSDKLNGYWEEGYHYYLEIRDSKLTVRNYMRAIALETTISYDAEALERGERTEITLKDNVLSRDYKGNMMTEIHALAYEGGELKMHYYYTIMGDTFYTLKKVDHGPFDHIIIRDDEFFKQLQGKWYRWSKDGKADEQCVISITGMTVNFPFSLQGGERFHVISRKYCPEKVFLVPENLIDGNFRGYTEIEVLPDMLTTTMMVCDMSMPLEVYARREKLDKITPPGAALRPAVNTMMPDRPNMSGPMMGFFGMGMGMNPAPAKPDDVPRTDPKDDGTDEYAKFCPNCGYKNSGQWRFCPECGTRL